MSKEKNLEQLIRELDELLSWFEQPDFDIEAALKKFDQGMELAQTIKQRLQKAENKIEILKQRFDKPA